MNVAILDHDWPGLLDTKILTLEVSKDAKVFYYEVNVRNADRVLDTMGQVKSDFGRIDYAVNCAGKPTGSLRVLDIHTLEEFTALRHLHPIFQFPNSTR